ncbi:MAG: glucose-6-phosphate isomerase, partial [Flavobacteriaceae bacterium]|nr:glucose-6-phosphate isomerase [Flavobacteriaceae bacterium]
MSPLDTQAWKKLKEHFDRIKNTHIIDLFDNNQDRAKEFSIKSSELFIDYSKNKITAETMDLLFELADEMELKTEIQKMFAGEKINQTENRAVLHTALRTPTDKSIIIDG